jgi:SAM-dependent methyltransferase
MRLQRVWRLFRSRAEPHVPEPEIAGSPDRPLSVEEMMPPVEVFSVGNGDFRAIGLGLLQELKDSCELQPGHRVLDVGCGIGRVAIPLTQYLSRDGAYEGFDPVERAIRHCQARITPSYPNFRFQVADLYNKTYNPRGRYRDSDYRFPYPEASFDVVFAASVFTHLLPPGTDRYIAESARVLKPGGRFFATFFLLNDASKEAMDAGRSTIGFPRRYAAHRLHSRRNPEAAVAYEEAFVLGLYQKHGLALTQPVWYGLWSGRPLSGYGGYQDLLVAVRPAP